MSKDWEGFESPHEHKVPAEALIWKHDCEVMGNGWNTWENGCRHCGKDKPKKQPTNMVTIPLDKLEDMQRRLKEQPTQEPMIIKQDNGMVLKLGYDDLPNGTPFYTHPKEWQGLSDDEIWNIANFLDKNKEWDYPVMFAKTIEQALKEKNT